MSDPRTQALEAARSMEQRGQLDLAVRAYLRAGSVADAARVLVGAKRFADAGHLVMESLGVGPALVGGLDPEKKKLAMKAAVCFAQAGDARRAVELFLALGDPARAAEAAERAGDPVEAARIRARIEKKSGSGGASAEMATAAVKAGALRLEQAGQLEPALDQYMQAKAFADAGRMAYKLKRFGDAARLFEDAGMAFEAAACFAEAGDNVKCLDAVLRVPREHPKYRLAAAQAVRLASELNVLDFKLDHFVGPYVAEGPKDERDLETFYALARLYRSRDFLENAREAYRKIVAVRPGFRDVAERLAKLDTETRGSKMAYEQIVREDSSFRGDARSRAGQPAAPAAPPAGGDDVFPDLPELPPPPAAPPPPKTAYIPGPTSGRMAAVDPSRISLASFNAKGTQPRAGTAVGGIASAAPPAPAPSAAPVIPGELAVGSVVADRYRVEARIGQGGMAAVYRATDLELGEEIAIKLFLQPSDDPQLLVRFKQELTLSRGLAHPNIVRLYDIGQHQGCRFLTMELLRGHDLGALLDGKPMELARGLRYLALACSALTLAHDKGVIHRDIKPANFFITTDDTLKVMDFGIAKRSTAQASMTQAGFIAGTPAYMSPEQINNFAAVSHRTDIYALGIVAYEMFTGAVPFDHAEMMQLLMMHLTREPEPPRAKNPAIPAELEEVILRLLEKDPAKRIQSCRELEQLFAAMIPRR